MSNPNPTTSAHAVAIALALQAYNDENCHDIESGVITIRPYKSNWGTMSFGLHSR